MASMNTSDELLRCPITLELFRDPVVAADGHTYERQAIEQYIRNRGTSPITRQPLSIEQLYPNRKVKELVECFETLLRQKDYQFILEVDVKKKKGRPLFMSEGKTFFGAEWLSNNNNRPEIVLLKIDGARAKQEASFYVNLSRHPYIIRTFGFVCDTNNADQNNSVLLLQEYAPEGSLYELLQERRTAPGEQILIEIFLQIIEAMICLASNHVVHGDLACRNVLVFRFDENQPERNVVKITDFGLSRHSQLYSRAPGAARTALNIVPVRYAAPEVLSSNVTSEIYTEKSDMYSMGVLMWEAYSRGLVPWTNIEDDNDVIRRVRNGDLLPQPPNCSQPFWSIIKKTWSVLPNDRPTFMELKRLLSAQYYPSGTILHNNTERYNTSIKYNLTESNRKEDRRQQKEQDRKLAQRHQEEEDRKLAQRHQEEEDRKFAQQEQRKYNETIAQEQQQEQERKKSQRQQQEGYREYAQQQQAKYSRKISQRQQQQQEQDRKTGRIIAPDERHKEKQGFKSNTRPETPGKITVCFGVVHDQHPSEYGRSRSLGGIPDPASKFSEVAALRATYDRDYVHGDRASRNRYAKTYADIAYAHPNILPVPMFCGDKDPPYEVPHPRFW